MSASYLQTGFKHRPGLVVSRPSAIVEETQPPQHLGMYRDIILDFQSSEGKDISLSKVVGAIIVMTPAD